MDKNFTFHERQIFRCKKLSETKKGTCKENHTYAHAHHSQSAKLREKISLHAITEKGHITYNGAMIKFH